MWSDFINSINLILILISIFIAIFEWLLMRFRFPRNTLIIYSFISFCTNVTFLVADCIFNRIPVYINPTQHNIQTNKISAAP